MAGRPEGSYRKRTPALAGGIYFATRNGGGVNSDHIVAVRAENQGYTEVMTIATGKFTNIEHIPAPRPVVIAILKDLGWRRQASGKSQSNES